MEDNKLLIGGLIILAGFIAFPIIAPMIRGNGYDPVADTHKVDALNKAVASYARTFNQYPPTLHHLVPKFIAEVPINSMRQQFQYDPRTGAVINPAAPAPVAPDGKTANKANWGQGGRGGGISPATDAMTGLSVSQELK